MTRRLVTKGNSHNPAQPVQQVVMTSHRSGKPVPSGICRIEVVCITDGEPRVWTDDGHSFTEGRTSGTARQQIERNMALRDSDGDPLFFVREPLTPWDGPLIDGERAVFDPIKIPVLDDRIRAKIAANRQARAAFLEQAEGHAGLTGKAVDKDAVATGLVETPEAKKARKAKEKTDGE
ncbi:MAG: hypothetical protein ACK52I_01660 [Pseudomonadota bacterium]|jgi:hypothetical protein